jgi:hypothetical protein
VRKRQYMHHFMRTAWTDESRDMRLEDPGLVGGDQLDSVAEDPHVV